jgi:hypothetical protein
MVEIKKENSMDAVKALKKLKEYAQKHISREGYLNATEVELQNDLDALYDIILDSLILGRIERGEEKTYTLEEVKNELEDLFGSEAQHMKNHMKNVLEKNIEQNMCAKYRWTEDNQIVVDYDLCEQIKNE